MREQIFDAIENEKDLAENARDEAKKQKERAETEAYNAIQQKLKTESAKQKAQAVLDKIYFYKDRFGLAFDKNNYSYRFIDKDLNTKIAFKYDEALPFDLTGFARVKMENTYFLIDTLGNKYPLATDINQLDISITALDLRNKNLSEIPPSVFKQTQLKVLILYKTN
ncbi:MAG: WG repeat-containing protein [Saprospiraceae bacterium]|nr:WG repeat-containing protein [Saprospiraceae bacterium]